MFARSYLRVKRYVLGRDNNWDNGGDECEDTDFGPQEPPLFDIDGRKGEGCQGIQVSVRKEKPSAKKNPDKVSVCQVSGLLPGRDGYNGEDSSVDLWNLRRAGSDCMLEAHIGDRNCEIKPFPVCKGASTTRVLVLFTPVFSFTRGIGRRSFIRFIENESCGVETDEGENGYKAENPINEDFQTAERVCVVTKLGKETVRVRPGVRFRWLLLDRILGQVCQNLFDKFAGRDVMNSNNEKRYCCKYRGQDKGILPYAANR